MKAEVLYLIGVQSPVAKISHKHEALEFSISNFGRENLREKLFDEINLYWEKQPPQIQDKIFQVYKEMYMIFENPWGSDDDKGILTEKVKQLIALHDLNEVEDWVCYQSCIIIPPFNENYQHSIDNNTSREKTYTRPDYVKLVVLSLVLRTMVPIWGEYIVRNRKESGTLYKEFNAFHLINTSAIRHSLALEKLKVYVEHIVDDDKHNASIILNSISSEDYPEWLLGLLCIRRLCIGDISGENPTMNLITYIYKYIIQKLRTSENRFDDKVKDKEIREGGNISDENKSSTLERYKIPGDISPGEITALEFSIHDPYKVASKLSCYVDPNFLQKSLETTNVLMYNPIAKFQVDLLRWIMKPVISPKGVLHIGTPTIVRSLAVAESVLWARGHKYLALLITARPMTNKGEFNISPTEAKHKVPKELMEELDKYYPYQQVTTVKGVIKNINPVIEAIDLVVENMITHSLILTAREELIQEVFNTNIRRIVIKDNIRTDLAKLIIELGARSGI